MIPDLDKSLVIGGTYTYTIRVDDKRDNVLFDEYDLQIEVCEFDMSITGSQTATYNYKSAVTFNFAVAAVANSPASCATVYDDL